ELFEDQDGGPVTGSFCGTFLPDGRKWLSLWYSPAGDGTVLKTIDLEKKLRIGQIVLPDRPWSAVAADATGQTVMTAQPGLGAFLWDANTGQPQAGPPTHTAAVNVLTFTPDGQAIITAGRDGAIIVWDAASGRKLRSLSGHAPCANDLFLGPQSTVVTCG